MDEIAVKACNRHASDQETRRLLRVECRPADDMLADLAKRLHGLTEELHRTLADAHARCAAQEIEIAELRRALARAGK